MYIYACIHNVEYLSYVPRVYDIVQLQTFNTPGYAYALECVNASYGICMYNDTFIRFPTTSLCMLKLFEYQSVRVMSLIQSTKHLPHFVL